MVVLTLRDYLVRDNRMVLLVLLAAVGLALLIACANLAGLLLTRGIGRRTELALRASPGAGRARLMQQLLVESLTISALGGLLGLLLGFWASRALVRISLMACSTDWRRYPRSAQRVRFSSSRFRAGRTTVVRSSAEPMALATAVRNEVAKVDPAQAVSAVQPMDQYVSAALVRPKLYSVLLAVFSTIALILAAIGLSGLMAYAVSRRTTKLGSVWRLAPGLEPCSRFWWRAAG